MLSEAVGLAYRANVRLFLDKPPAGGERLAVNFQQIEFFHLVFEYAQCRSGSQTLRVFEQRPQHYYVGCLRGPEFVGDLRRRNRDGLHFRSIKVGRQADAVIKNDSAPHYLVGKLAQRELIHGYEYIRVRDQGRPNALFRQANMAVRAARTHLRTIRRQPAHFQSFPHAHFDEELPHQQHALSAEAGDFDLNVSETMGVFRFGGIVRSLFRSDLKHIRYRALRRLICRGSFRPAIAENVERKGWRHLLENPPPRFHWVLAPNRRTRRQDLDKREARAIPLDLECFADCPPRFHDVLVVR